MKQNPQLQFGTAIALTWLDSKALSGWQYGQNKPSHSPGVIRTIGRVVDNNKFGLTVTTSIGMNKETIDDLTIPWGAIYELEVLEGREIK